MGDNSVESNFENPNTTIAVILVSIFLLGAGTSLQATAVALRAGVEGFSDLTVGIISSGYFTGLLCGSFLAIIMIRNVGYVRAFAAFASLASATSLAHILFINPVAWLFFRFINGLCISIVLVVVESWLNASVSNSKRGSVLSLYGVVYLTSNGIGQPLVGIFAPASFEIFAITSILVSLCLIPVSLAQVTGNPKIKSIKLRIKFIFAKSPLGGFGVIVSGIVTGIQLSLGPLFAQSIGLENTLIGFFLLTVSIGTMAIQWPLGWFSDNKGRRPALLLSSGLGGIASFLLALAVGSGPYLLAVSFLFGGFAIPLYSLSIATVNDQLLPEDMVEASSALYIFYGIGSIIGPFTASVIMHRFGTNTMYFFISAILFLYLGFDLIRILLVPRFKVRGKSSHYRTMPTTSVIAYNMLKRVNPAKKKQNKKENEDPRII